MAFRSFLSACLLSFVASCAVEGDEPDFELGQIEQAVEQLSAEDKAIVNAPFGTWTYVSFPDTKCRDGSPSGLAVRRSKTSNRVLIYMEGGGICFDKQTCADNPSNTSTMRAAQISRLGGLFNFNNPKNPVKDWNIVYVPYCSGDLHAGKRENVSIAGVGVQQFVGRKNLERFLRPIAQLVSKPSDVLLTGSSAGGFGAALSAPVVQAKFGSLRIRLIDDSGPFLDNSALPECLQTRWRETFGWDATFLTECGASCPRKSNYFQDYITWLASVGADRPIGLVSSSRDFVISSFFAIGLDTCTTPLWTKTIDGAVFTKALKTLRSKVSPYGMNTFYTDGETHTYFQDDGFYGARAGNFAMVDWFTRIANNQRGGNYGL